MSRYRPMEPEQIEWLKGMISGGVQVTDVAKSIGIPRSTLSDVLDGGNVVSRTRKKVEEFVRRQKQQPAGPVESAEKGKLKLQIDIPMPEVTGNEKSLLSPEAQKALFMEFKISADFMLPALKTLVNGDVGTRTEFHRQHGKDYQDLLILLQALSSESALAAIKRETGKDILP